MDAKKHVDKYDLFVMSLARCGTNFISRCLNGHPYINPLDYTRNEIVTRHHRVDIFNNHRLSYYHLHVVNHLSHWDLFSKILTKKHFLYTVRNPLDLAVSFYNFSLLQYYYGYRVQRPSLDSILLSRDFLVRQNSIAIGLSLESEFHHSKCIGFSSLRLDKAQNTINDISHWLGIESYNIDDLSKQIESSLSLVLSFIPMTLMVYSKPVQIFFCEHEGGPATSGFVKHIFRRYIKVVDVDFCEYNKLYGFVDSDFFASIAAHELDSVLYELGYKIRTEFKEWIEMPLSMLHSAQSEYIERLPKSIEIKIINYYKPYVSQLDKSHPNILDEW
ncbi:sulfotransferase domain-containing protein [Aeromonas hydrophila]|uniref:sulfotransferase domain-containing protein n=1 Tax=Aeromonas hydrophila TaxID=644 RepID=UPI00191CF561|nr:sulfotransferase domain-containing protein [Aeromonas hydrophila]MBL0435239.1 sulfotransferase domain-containing protein [Aeromonas hydrophila]MBL0471084.1 sulfotransferase domain-containing protein [Aeromonas hydrophila]HDT5892326.1 sulfotransferase domain-containing protein [Aeromonas hydrophila subsp. hydrophila]